MVIIHAEDENVVNENVSECSCLVGTLEENTSFSLSTANTNLP